MCRIACGLAVLCGMMLALIGPVQAQEQDEGDSAPVRGSLVEDRAARKLLEAGDSRYEADETKKALEIWQSVIERYPRSRVRFQAHMKLGDHFLQRERAYERARVHFQAVADEENRDEDQRADATLKMGVCFYEAGTYGKSFQIMRDVIEKYPVSSQVNEAYYYIGLGHFKLGHYSRAIAALENVGTTLAGEKGEVEKVEAGKRLFVKIEDADLAALEPGANVIVRCETTSGDAEIVECFPLGRNVRVVLGSIPTVLGKPFSGNGRLELKGDDKVKVTYTDRHTADKEFDRPVARDITVVGDGVPAITDGAFSESLNGVVLGKTVNIQISDPDRDTTDDADKIAALVEVFRRKTEEELDAEAAALSGPADGEADPLGLEEDGEPKVEQFKKIDAVDITLTEVKIERKLRSSDADTTDLLEPDSSVSPTPDSDNPQESGQDASSEAAESEAASPEPADDGSIHTGVFRAVVTLARSETIDTGDDALQALPGDVVRVTYRDELNSGETPIDAQVEAKCVDGNLGGVRVTRAVISDEELRIKTQLKTASALTNIGNRYKEFGLKRNADAKYDQALAVCEEIMTDARRLGGTLLEQTYVQLWQVYYEMDQLNLAAAMCQRLQREFPNSGFVDDALLQLADVAREQGNLQRAIGIYNRLVGMETSQLRGEAQFGVAACYETMAEEAEEAGSNGAAQLYDRSFQEYKKVFDNFPESGRVGEAVAKMANYYYKQQDYARAIDTFETVLSSYPDAKFLDVILFNYGRCLYRMQRRGEARQKFDQLIGEFPESPLAGDSKRISDALAKAGF